MLLVVVRIVSIVGIPRAGEEISLPTDRATLHMYAIDEAMLDFGSAPVAAPDEPAPARAGPGMRNHLSTKVPRPPRAQCHRPSRSDEHPPFEVLWPRY